MTVPSGERERIFADLKLRSLSMGYRVPFTTTGRSMLLLIAPGDDLLVEKAPATAVRLGDVLLWRAAKKPSAVPTAHRVIAIRNTGAGRRFLTKGDFNLCSDRYWVSEDEIIGKVTALGKGRFQLVIDRGIGRWISYAAVVPSFFACIVFVLARAAARTFRRFLPEEPFPFELKGLLLRSGIPFTAQCWAQSLIDVAGRLETPAAGEQVPAVADLHIGGGYSEEAAAVIRKGIPVESIGLLEDLPAGHRCYEHVILARSLPFLPADLRREAFRKARELLVPGGTLYVSGARFEKEPSRSAHRDLKRRFWALVLGKRYRGPKAGDRAMDGRFVLHNFTRRGLLRETQRSGFLLRQAIAGQGILKMILSKGKPAYNQ